MRRLLAAITIAALALGLQFLNVERAGAQAQAVTAIDIGLEPDTILVSHAQAANARLLKIFPDGFALDASHHPHVTVLQRYVRTVDLTKVYAAAGRVLAADDAAGLQLSAYRYFGAAWGKGVSLVVILLKASPALLKLQADIIAAVGRYTVASGTAAAYYTTPAAPDINQPTLEYVATFVSQASGKKYYPHVTVGAIASDQFAGFIGQPFSAFTFSPVAASVFQLGNDGTARVKLKTWSFEQ